jgi:hypothetical protein
MMSEAEERELVIGKVLAVLAVAMIALLSIGNVLALVQTTKLSTCVSKTISTTSARQGFSDEFASLDNRESQVFVDAFDRKITPDQGKEALRKIQAERQALVRARDNYQAPKLEKCR